MPTNSIDDRKNCVAAGAEPLPPLPPGVARGLELRVRGERWRLVATIDRTDCRELHLAHALRGERRVLLWPFDRPSGASPDRPGFAVVPLRRWLRTVARVEPGIDFTAPRAQFAGQLLPYQLAPAMAMAGGSTRLLLADEVGLGKTIQAGWIIGDLIAREATARVIVAVPASLRTQWGSELGAHFRLEPMPVDAAWLRHAVADRPADVSPWAAPGIYLGSIDFFKRADVAASLQSVVWDLVVVDEAHAATAPTERYAAIAAIASQARRLVLMTATPYSGDPRAFASLLSLGACPGDERPVMFRRSREDVGDPRRRRHRFALVRLTSVERRLQRLLERYSSAVWHEAPAEVERARLAMTILRKRALSSPTAALRSLARRLALLTEPRPAARQLALFDDEAETDDDLGDAALATPGLGDFPRERRWLAALVEAATHAARADSKQRRLLRILSRAAEDAVIVFSEYRDTLRQLAQARPDALQLHGGLTIAERDHVQRRFNTAGGLLLATDAAADGLNLQHRCRLLVNYELPWNPARLEQRIGRVDRIGQRRAVHAITLVARDTAEDLVVARFARRLARVARTLGERDRLAAFLNEARTAQAVIGGIPLEERDESSEAEGAACEVRNGPCEAPRETCAVRSSTFTHGDDERVVVASVHATSSLRPGLVAVVRFEACGEDGFVAASRAIGFHVGRPDTVRPRTWADARAAVSWLHADVAAGRLVPAEISAWLADVRSQHEQARSVRIGREAALAGRRAASRATQPGLFDSRALQQRELGAARERERAAEHQQRLLALARGQLELRATLAAALIVWR